MKHTGKLVTAALVLVCAALCVGLWYQSDRLVRLEEKVAALDARLQAVSNAAGDLAEVKRAQDDIKSRLTNLEKPVSQTSMIRSYSMTMESVDLDAAAVTLHLSAELDIKNQNARPELVVIRQGASSRFPLERTGEGTYEGAVELSMEQPETGGYFQIAVTDGGESRAEELCRLSNLVELLELKVQGSIGDAVYHNDALEFTGWSVEALNAKTGSETLRVYRNGDLLQEFPLEAAMDFDQACAAGDTVELRYAAEDQWGIHYEYSLKWWKITEAGTERHWPTSAYPTLVWG